MFQDGQPNTINYPFYSFGGNCVADAADQEDRALISRIINGDDRALAILYQRHGLAVLRYLIGLLGDQQQAEEIVQDVMMTLWQKAAGFRQESSVRTWLLTIARNKALNARTRQHAPNGSLVSLDDAMPLADKSLLPGEQMMQAAEHDQMRAALALLSEAQRETLELIFYHALSGPEAARVLGVAPGTIKSRLSRALAKLQMLLQREAWEGRMGNDRND